MRLDKAKQRFATFGVALAGILAGSAFMGCSDSNVAGNSAETGSPELAGVLYLDGGKPAALARVQCVPSHFDVLHDTLPGFFQTVADDSGAYVLDSVPTGTYSLEAFDPESGKMLLVQHIEVPDSGRVAISDTLQSSGYFALTLEDESLDGVEGSALVVGTTILRHIKVVDGVILVDSLPADSMDIVLQLNDGAGEFHFGVNVPAADTVEIVLEPDTVAAPVDTIIKRYVASLAWPVEVDSSVDTYSSDIPLAIRLDSSNCDFAELDSLTGRWEAYRFTKSGSRSASLPISLSYFDTESQQALFWVRVDSLNVSDSLELVFNTSRQPVYALDVFPTSRAYTAVYHFDDGVETISDEAEKQGYVATGHGLKSVDGVLGNAASFDGSSYMVVDSSAACDTIRKTHLNYAFKDNFNLSLWVKLDRVDTIQTIVAKGQSQYDLRFSPDSGIVAQFYHKAEDYKDSTSDTTSYRMVIAAGASLVKAGQWMFVSVNGYWNYKMFIDGVVQDAKAAKVDWPEGNRSEGADLEVGRMNAKTGDVEYFKGAVDELFISRSVRNDAWISASYYNQKPGSVWPKIVAK